MTDEKWIIKPGETRVIDLDGIHELKIGLVRGQVDVVAHDDPHVRVEVHSVSGKDLRIERTGGKLDVDHPQLKFGNFIEMFKNMTNGGPSAEVSIAVPRGVELNLGVVSASALVSGLAARARMNTVSGDLLVDELVGDLAVNTVSGDVQVRSLAGPMTGNTVSGDISVTGRISRASIDSVSGSIYIDAQGEINRAAVNTVSGDVTVRLDDDYAANYVLRSASGKIKLDGTPYSTSGPTNYTGSRGELAGRFVDANVNTVSGDITVLRRGESAGDADAQVEWPGQAEGSAA
ncbi:MAG: DUF4097 family beta strand repeat-containing protein [Microbacterium sp.]